MSGSSSDPRSEKRDVTCEVRASEGCVGTHAISVRAERQNRSRNGGQYMCLPCSRRIKFSGRSNPNATYVIDDGCMETIDSEGKAYVLGWVASDGSIHKNTISIVVHQRDKIVLDQLRRIICSGLPIRRKRDSQFSLTINSRRIAEDVRRHLQITTGPKSRTVGWPQLGSSDLSWAFLRGFFDGDGSVSLPKSRQSPQVNIATSSGRMRQAIVDFCPFSCTNDAKNGSLWWYGNNALDFLARMYDGATYRLQRKYDLYLDWCTWIPSLSSGPSRWGRSLHFRWTRTDERAVPPFKERASDSGYDLTLIDVARTFGQMTLYTTGVKVQPEFGWYFDLVPRSSLAKSGYILANSIGIIDRTYTGPILVPLIKLDPSAEDLRLPARLVQIIPRPVVHVEPVEVDELDDTHRGSGGFGSTGR